MKIPDSFLEPEVREGFYIPSAIKQAWAVSLQVLEEIDKICKKYNILYFADWGTLLGIVRHGGFIPWDDDLDITMKRKDYERFMAVAKKELPEGFSVVTYANQSNFRNFLGRIVAKDRICFDEDHLREHFGFPYIVGIDIFVLDYIYPDEEREKKRVELAKHILAVADGIEDGQFTITFVEPELRKIEKECGIKLKNRGDTHKLWIELYQQVEKLFSMVLEEEATELTRMMPDGLRGNKQLRMPKEYYDKQVWLPFEHILLPVPGRYDEMLRRRYGDYMKLVRDCGGHDYPFFEKQKQDLQAVLDFELPGYRYTGIVTGNREQGKENSLKEMLRQAYQELKKYAEILREGITAEVSAEEILPACQQLAIDMGTLIEQGRWEGHPTVSVLEEYCEAIYQLSQKDIGEGLEELDSVLAKLGKSLQKEILERREAVFLPYKASQWSYIESVWQAAVEDENCDVYVIPIPYFYKEYDGQLRDMQYEAEQFPEEVKLTRYDAFNFGLHYPDMIFIQNPYDEFDPIISVHTFFYSTNLKNYTEKLVYIPPFYLEEFEKENYREYHNMQYYCTVPGVVNADSVIVQSENMKQLYIEKLTEFAGEDTRELWKEKIQGLGSPKEDVQNPMQYGRQQTPEEWQSWIEKEDGKRKKVILYYTGLSSFIQYGERMLKKVQEVFRIFSENKEEVVLLWKPHGLIKTTLEQIEPELYHRYCQMEQEYLDRKLGILDTSSGTEPAVSICDGYYGDTSPIAQACRNMGKSVMLQQVE